MSNHTIDNVSISGSPLDSDVQRASIQEWAYHFVAVTELCTAVFGSPMNMLVLFTALVRRGGASTKSRRSITELLVISMTVADLLFCVCHSPLMFAQISYALRLPYGPCTFLYTVTHLSTIASSLSLLWLNVNKFLQLHKPLHYFLYMTKSRAMVFIVCGWLVSAVWSVFFVFGPFLHFNEHCSTTLHYKELYILFATEFFILPTVVSLFVSVDIALVVLGEKRRFFSQHFGNHKILGNAKCKTGTKKSAKPRNLCGDSGALKRLGFVFATTVWSSITVLPYRLAFIMHLTPGYRSTSGFMTWSFFLFGVMAVNALGNPFITLMTHKQYYSRVRDWIGVLRRLCGAVPAEGKNIYVMTYTRTST